MEETQNPETPTDGEDTVEPIEIRKGDCNNLCQDDRTGEAFICSRPEGHPGVCSTKGENGLSLTDSSRLKK